MTPLTPFAIDTLALFKLAPAARPLYRQAFTAPEPHLAAFGVLETKRRADHFLAQILHESGAMRNMLENLSYSAERLVDVWPSRFQSIAEAMPFARNPRALAAKVYGNRMGNTNADDAFNFIGRGFLQLTGRVNYARIGHLLEADLVTNPDWVLLPEYALRVAGAIWQSAGCNALADRDSLIDVTRAINGGLNGLDARGQWLQRVRAGNVVRV